MKITANAETSVDMPKHMRRIESDSFWKFAANEWYRLYFPYVPFHTGNLAETVNIRPGEIEHKVPYAHSAYTQNRRFRRDKHPLASSKWDKAAEPAQKPKLIKSMQNYIDAGRLGLGE